MWGRTKDLCAVQGKQRRVLDSPRWIKSIIYKAPFSFSNRSSCFEHGKKKTTQNYIRHQTAAKQGSTQ
jgi:hypothetical protein